MDGCDNCNDINNLLGINDSIDNAYDCGEANGLQSLSCIICQYQSLVILLIILYAWSNQYTENYLMASNNQLNCTLSCLLDKLVDSAIDNCKNCANCGAVNPATANNGKRRHKHKRHRHKYCDYDCDCDYNCDCDCDCDCDCQEC